MTVQLQLLSYKEQMRPFNAVCVPGYQRHSVIVEPILMRAEKPWPCTGLWLYEKTQALETMYSHEV